MFYKKAFKKLFPIFITIIILYIGQTLTITANANDVIDFSDLSELDSMQFVEENNIKIPEFMLEHDDLASFTRTLIMHAYKYPEFEFPFNYYETQEYAENIRLAVRDYMISNGISSSTTFGRDELTYNTAKDSTNTYWTKYAPFYIGYENYKHYNCYAYAIHRSEKPSYYLTSGTYNPGDMSNPDDPNSPSTFTQCNTIHELAEIVRDDLIAMGYSNVQLTTYIPSVNSSQELICVRMGTIQNSKDYHFMRYDLETNSWYHKPGGNLIMKYNSSPSDGVWRYEYCAGSTVTLIEGSCYDSEIVYIRFSKNQINAPQSTSTRKYIQAQGNGPKKDILCEINIPTTGKYNLRLTASYTLQYYVYDEDLSLVFSGTGTNIDEYWYATEGKYYLRVNFAIRTLYHYVDIQVINHTHSYDDSYIWYSYAQHRNVCECGVLGTLSSHVLSSSISPGQYSTCLLCGNLASEGVVANNVSNNLIYISSNDYAILNIVDVLLDKKTKAYLCGEFIFCSKKGIST